MNDANYGVTEGSIGAAARNQRTKNLPTQFKGQSAETEKERRTNREQRHRQLYVGRGGTAFTSAVKTRENGDRRTQIPR